MKTKNRPFRRKPSKAQVQKNDRFTAIRIATMGDVEIADEVVPRSAYELP